MFYTALNLVCHSFFKLLCYIRLADFEKIHFALKTVLLVSVSICSEKLFLFSIKFQTQCSFVCEKYVYPFTQTYLAVSRQS